MDAINNFMIVNDDDEKFFKCIKCSFQCDEASKVMEHAYECQGVPQVEDKIIAIIEDNPLAHIDVKEISGPSGQESQIDSTKPAEPIEPNRNDPNPVEPDKTFCCTLCCRNFSSKQELEDYLLKHWPFKCHICDGKFKTEVSLRSHALLYHSSDCDSPRELYHHIITLNNQPLVIHCNYCPRLCKDYEESDAHMRDLHKNQPEVETKRTKIEENAANMPQIVCDSLLVPISAENAKKTYKCAECMQVFDARSNYREHIRIHRPHKCNVCKKRFKTEYFFRIHELAEHNSDYNKDSTVCKICIEDFDDPTTLFLHLIREHQLARLAFACHLCPKTFSFERTLKLHLETKHKLPIPSKRAASNLSPSQLSDSDDESMEGCSKDENEDELKAADEEFELPVAIEKPCFCLKCNKKFENLLAVCMHEISEHDMSYPELERKCCKRYEPLSSSWLLHLRSNHSFNEHKCQFCTKQFEQEFYVRLHVEIKHRHRKDCYECNVCGSIYNNQSSMKEHSISHANARCITKCGTCNDCTEYVNLFQHECQYCDERFLFEMELLVHNKEQHTTISNSNKNNLECGESSEQLDWSTKLECKDTSILKTCSLESYKCPRCSLAFSSEEDCYVHEIRSHIPYQFSPMKICVQCDLNFDNRWTRLWHFVSEHKKVYSCKTCTKSFIYDTSLSNHIERMHSVDNDKTVCKQCNKTLTTEKQLWSHEIAEHDVFNTSQFYSKPKVGWEYDAEINESDDCPFDCGVCDVCERKQGITHECEICKVSYESDIELTVHHAEKHSAEYKTTTNECSLCERKCNSYPDLAVHQKLFHSEKSFQCKFCRNSYQFVQNMHDHMWKKHISDQEIVRLRCKCCSICLKNFPSVNLMKKHTQQILHRCNYCKKLGSIDKYREHFVESHVKDVYLRNTKSEQQICPVCMQIFNSAINLRRHEKNVHVNLQKFKCGTCCETFAGIFELKAHLDESNKCQMTYRCGFCKLIQKSVAQLLGHMWHSHIVNTKRKP